MATFLDQNFGDDSDDEGDFNPEQVIDSDVESNGSVEKETTRNPTADDAKRSKGVKISDNSNSAGKPRKASLDDTKTAEEGEDGDDRDREGDVEESQDDLEDDDEDEDEEEGEGEEEEDEEEEDAVSVRELPPFPMIGVDI